MGLGEGGGKRGEWSSPCSLSQHKCVYAYDSHTNPLCMSYRRGRDRGGAGGGGGYSRLPNLRSSPAASACPVLFTTLFQKDSRNAAWMPSLCDPNRTKAKAQAQRVRRTTPLKHWSVRRSKPAAPPRPHVAVAHFPSFRRPRGAVCVRSRATVAVVSRLAPCACAGARLECAGSSEPNRGSLGSLEPCRSAKAPPPCVAAPVEVVHGIASCVPNSVCAAALFAAETWLNGNRYLIVAAF